MRLEGPVTDTAGALDGRVADVEGAIDRTLDDHGVQVFVLFVRTTGDVQMADYAQGTADVNSLGVDDALLVVAMDDRTDYIWVSDGLDEITDDELDTILVEELEPRLRDGDAPGPRSQQSRLSASQRTPLPRPTGRSCPGPCHRCRRPNRAAVRRAAAGSGSERSSARSCWRAGASWSTAGGRLAHPGCGGRDRPADGACASRSQRASAPAAGECPAHRDRRAGPRRSPGDRLRRGAVRARSGRRAAGRGRGCRERARGLVHAAPAARRRPTRGRRDPRRHDARDRGADHPGARAARRRDGSYPTSCAISSGTPRPRSSSCPRGSRRSRIGCRLPGPRSTVCAPTPSRRGSPSAATSRKPRRGWPVRALRSPSAARRWPATIARTSRSPRARPSKA